MPGKNHLINALKEGYNIAGVASFGVAYFILGGPGPVLVGLAAEAIYLGFVPKSSWYVERLARRYDKEVLVRRERMKLEIGPTLPQSVMARFSRLETTRNQIGSQTIEGKKWFREVLRKLDYLMEKFLLFASKQVQFQTYIRSVLEETDAGSSPQVAPVSIRKIIRKSDSTGELDEAWIVSTVETIQNQFRSEIEGIDSLLKKDENSHNQAVLEKRKNILTRRKQYVGQIGEILTNLNHQLHLMEDTFGLINDEIRARSPEQVLADIEDLVFQTDSLTEALQKVSPFDQMSIAPGGDKLYEKQ